MLNYVKKQGGTDMKKKRIRAIMNLVQGAADAN